MTCLQSGKWSLPTGCVIIECPITPEQAGYAFTAGSVTPGATRQAECAVGYTGAATAITCNSAGTWSLATGCSTTLFDCGVPVNLGYSFAAGGTTEGSARAVSCTTGYTGSPSATQITCDSQGQGGWSPSNLNGCIRYDCGTPSQTGYVITTGSTLYGSSASVACAYGWEGAVTVNVVCQANGWDVAQGCTEPREYSSIVRLVFENRNLSEWTFEIEQLVITSVEDFFATELRVTLSDIRDEPAGLVVDLEIIFPNLVRFSH